MPSIDRRWRWIFAIALFAGVWIALALVLNHAVDFIAGSPPPTAGPGAVKWSDVWSGLGLLAGAWAAFSFVSGARSRQRLRALALAGEADALLPARALPHLEDSALPDLAREPLRLLWRTRRGVSGVIATSEGLAQRRPRKPDALLRWEDARLLEVWRLDVQRGYAAGYALFGGVGRLVEWQEYREGKAYPAEKGVSFAEMQRRQHALLALIAARTGLAPRTQVLELADLPPSPAPTAMMEPRASAHRVTWFGLLVMALLPGVPLALAVAALALPLTRTPLLNAYVAATIGAPGLLILGFELWGLAHKPSQQPAPLVLLPSVPPDLARLAQPVRLRAPGMLGQRLACLAGALLLAGDGYALLRALVDALTDLPSSRGSFVLAPDSLRQTVLGALTLIVLFGMAFCSFGLFERRSVVTADADGVHWRRGGNRTTLAWESISHLVAHTSKGQVQSFGIESDDAEATEISWAAQARWRPRPLPARDGDAAELAALVAQRTGLALTLKDAS